MLIIPDLYDHVYVREMSDLLFRSLGFKQILLQQEALCICFGAGLGTACVIDIGASKASVTCVEEGSILPDTRMRLAFGGDDISVVLTEMLRRQNLPCRIDLDTPWDFATMDDIKEQISVLSEGDVGLNIYSAYKRDPAGPTVKFELRVYDEVIVAPMVRLPCGSRDSPLLTPTVQTLFAPRIIDFDRKLSPGPVLYSSAAELDDVLDLGGNAVTEAMRSCTAHLHPQSSAAAPETGDSVPQEPATDELMASAPASPSAGDAAVAPLSTMQTRLPSPEAAAPIEVRAEASKIPLHVAVAESILAVGSEERAKRLLSAIMVVGGGGLIHNVGYAIASR